LFIQLPHKLAICLALICSVGCTLFRSPSTEIPKSRYDSAQASYDDDKPNPEDQTPLFSTDNLKKENVRRNLKTLVGQGPNKEIAQQNFNQGRELFEQARASQAKDNSTKALFHEAAEAFTTAADRWPDSALEQDALFMAGDSYFFADELVDSNKCFELLLKRYPNTRHIDVVESRRFLIAKYWLAANDQEPYPFYMFNWTDETRPWYDTRGHALRVYDKMKVDDPTGKLADDAIIAHANELFSKSEFEKADQQYTDLIKAYPDSEHQFSAHFLGLKAKLNSYRGSDYAGQSLDEGEKLIKQIRRQFPQESKTEREYLDRAFAEIRYKKAERHMRMAQYYDNRGEFGGARYYYDIVIREFDDTPLAARAQQRSSEIAPKPEKTEKPFRWVANIFPESDKLKPILDKATVKPGETPRTGTVQR
jgi:outer membrane protein assembly factor BamD (BamD/ComL family)